MRLKTTQAVWLEAALTVKGAQRRVAPLASIAKPQLILGVNRIALLCALAPLLGVTSKNVVLVPLHFGTVDAGS